MSRLFDIQNLSVSFGETVALSGVSLSVDAGQVVCLVGESGSGKSTLIRAALALLPGNAHVQGDAKYRGQSVYAATANQLRAWRGLEWGMVPQDARASFAPTRTVESQLAEMAQSHGYSWGGEVCNRALDLLSQLNIEDSERLLQSYPFQLSGGQCQRVGVVAALLLEPSIVFADEPTSALDVVSQKSLVGQLKLLCETSNTALVLASHNMAVARALGGEVLVLREGCVVEQGPSAQVLSNPQVAYTAQLVGASRLPKVGELL